MSYFYLNLTHHPPPPPYVPGNNMTVSMSPNKKYLDLIEGKIMFLGKLVNFLTLPSFPVDAVSELLQSQSGGGTKRSSLPPVSTSCYNTIG